MTTAALNSKNLKAMLRITLQMERLQIRLNGLAGNGTANGHVTKRQMSPEAKARIITAQKKRWAAWRKARR